jgi:3-methyladenine DNA glycosylase/8-oxoguanine DNA glycosylase
MASATTRKSVRRPAFDIASAEATVAAVRHLSSAHARWPELIARVGPYCPSLISDPFIALVGSILHQQVSMSAATTIFMRVKALCPRGRIAPQAILAISNPKLRSAGLSRQKAAYMHNLADAFATRQVTPAALRRAPDDEVVELVTQIKGVGRWTAEMLLMFCLHRPDVWPIHDLGLQKAALGFFQLRKLPTPQALSPMGDTWRPYRTYATWYLWRSLEHPIPPSVTH